MTRRSVKRWLATAGASVCAMVAPLVVLAAPTAPADDIRDIRPLISIPPWWYWLAAGLAAALIVALIFVGIRYWRRRQRALTPEQSALRALDEAEALARSGQCREWADIVAETLRTALASRLERESCPETTGELAAVDWSKLTHGSSVDAPRLVELLSTCDLTRFALGRLDPSALLGETERARAWITTLFAQTETRTRAVTQPPPETPPHATEATS